MATYNINKIKAPNGDIYNIMQPDAVLQSEKGVASGVATLGTDGKIPSSQLPSYVDDVLEYSAKSQFPATGETGKIYVDTATNTTYRWGGSSYVAIGSDLALGETSSTAYRGDRGKAAYDHISRTDNPHNVTAAQVGALPDTTVIPQGTVTSVRVQATSPVRSSVSTAQTGTLNTTISLANAYGDTKNPYGTKTANYVLAGPRSGSAAAPSFRALVAADIPALDYVPTSGYVATDNNYTTTEKDKLAGIAAGAEVNQNAFSTVKVGTTNLSADTKTDTLTITAGSNITLTPTASSDSFTIAATVPTNVGAFTNDVGYITSADVPEGASAYTGTISAVGTTASSGTNNGFARGDHVHNLTKTTVDSVLGTGSGTTKFYREDGSWATPANTDTKVKQEALDSSNDSQYPVLMGYSAINSPSTETNSARKHNRFYYTASTGALHATQIDVGSQATPGSVTLGRYTITATADGSNRYTATLPTKTGTIALTSDIPTVVDTYSSTSSNAISGKGVAAALGTLDSSISGTTTTAISSMAIQDGKISSSTSVNVDKVTQEMLGGTNSTRSILFSAGAGTANTFDKTYITSKIQYNDNSGSLMFNPKNTSTTSKMSFNENYIQWATISGNNQGRLMMNSATSDHTYLLPDKTGTLAVTTDIPTVPTNVSAFTNDAGYLTSYTETDPTVPTWAKARSKPSYTAGEISGLGAAATKRVDTSISVGSTSTNLPTTAAVVNYVASAAPSVTPSDFFTFDSENGILTVTISST